MAKKKSESTKPKTPKSSVAPEDSTAGMTPKSSATPDDSAAGMTPKSSVAPEDSAAGMTPKSSATPEDSAAGMTPKSSATPDDPAAGMTPKSSATPDDSAAEGVLITDVLESGASKAASASASYQVVARRYRPQEFGALIGQDHIAKALIGAIKTGRVGHAYLFTGARGVGKTSSARILAKALNCVQGPTPTPCNECEICRAISGGDDIDVLEIDGASNRGIDEIRQLRQSATIRPSRARYKIYIIDEVHMLTREAFNALLKTLEEPPEHVKFIFCTTEPTKLPITILSRCQRFDFAGINARTIADHLEYIAQNEGIAVEEGVCETLARRANGSMRDAQSLLEQLLSFAPDRIALSDVHGMLGTVDDQKIYDLMTAIRSESPGNLFPILNKSADEGVDFGVLLEQLTGTFRDLLVLSCDCGPDSLLYSSVGRFDEMKEIAAAFGPDRILASMQILSQTITRMRYSTQGRILAEMALVRLCALGRLEEVARLIDQLKKGDISGPTVVLESLPSNSVRSNPLGVAPPTAGPSSTGRVLRTEKKTADLTGAETHSFPASRASDSSSPGDGDRDGLGDAPNASPGRDAFVSKAAEPEDEASQTMVGHQGDPPQTGVEAEKKERVRLDSLSQERLVQIWRRAVDSLGLALSSASKSCSQLTWTFPVLRVGFAPNQTQPMNYCQKEASRILASLKDFSDDPIRLEFYLTDEPVPVSEKPRQTVFSTAARFEQMRKKIGHPMIREAEKLFGAELADVRDDKPADDSHR